MVDENEKKISESNDKKKPGLANMLFAYIPGTKQERMRRKRSVAKELKERKKTFAELKNLDSQMKQQISSAFRYHAKNNAITDGISRYYLELLFYYFIVLFIFLAIGLPFVVANFYKLNEWITLGFIYILPCFLLSILVLVISFFLLSFILRVITSPWSLLIIIILSALIIFYPIFQLIPQPVSLLAYALTTPIIIVETFLVIASTALILLWIGLNFYTNQRNKKYIESYLVDQYLSVIKLLETPNFLAKVENRKEVQKLFDDIYKSTKGHLKKSVEIKDQSMSSWYDTKILQVAAAVHDIGKTVLFSDSESFDNAVLRVCKNFVATVSGNLKNCEIAEPEKIENHNKFLYFISSIWNFLKKILVAILPTGLFMYLQTTQMKINAELSQYATLFCIGWLVFFSAQIIDPNLSDKLGVIKEAVNNFPGIGKK